VIRPTGAASSVVSLVPSISETLVSWGVRPAAVTRFCEVPGLATVGGTKNPDVPAIVAMAPELVLMDEEENRVEDAEALRRAGIRVHATHVRSVADVRPTLEQMWNVLGRPDPAPGPYADVKGSAGARGLDAGERRPEPTVWVPIWRRPWMSIGADTYASSLLSVSGLRNVHAASAIRYPTTTIEEAAAFHPDFVLAPSEPYRFSERHRRELETVAPVVFVDGQDLFWWGVRTPAALGRMLKLAATLVPR
jgi:ABC-type Fe3+-hydroxamate transport system substrate-binding protein